MYQTDMVAILCAHIQTHAHMRENLQVDRAHTFTSTLAVLYPIAC